MNHPKYHFLLRILVVKTFIFVLPTFLYGQRVALVLSGGGAKGLAHIGALKALEENHIPIDYVVGTSMGGIVGGLYAAGYSPAEMENIVTEPHFQNWLKGILSEQYTYFYSKRDPDASIFTLDLSVDSSFTTTVNNNLASDHAINFVFAEMLSQASQRARNNFDSLMVPFRTVASDIFLQQEYILKGGYLNKAVRATMTVPLFYRPIKVHGKYLFDGGIYNNFPVDVAKDEFKTDYVIGINVSSKKLTEYPYDEDDRLMSESLAFLFLKKTDPQAIGRNGIYIEPDLSLYSSIKFENAKTIIDSGYVETLRKIPEIKAAVARRVSDNQIKFKREKFKSGFKPLVFGDIRLTGFNSRQRNYVRKMFNKRNSQIPIEKIKSVYYKLISESYFKNIFPNIIYNQATGNFDLEIEAKQAKNFKVDLGGNISTRGISQVFLGFQLNHFHSFLGSYDLNFYTGRFYQSIQAKPRFNFPSNKLVYVEPEVTLNSWNYIDGSDVVFGQTNRPVLNQTDRKYGLNLGIAAGNKGKIIWQASHINNTDHFGNSAFFFTSDTLDILKFRGFRYGVAYSRNTLNRKQYADDGSQLYAAVDFIDGNETYRPGSSSEQGPVEGLAHQWFRITGKAEKYYAVNPIRMGIYIETVLSNQPLFTNYRASLINSPSFLPLQDSRSLFLEKYRAFNYTALGLKNVVRLSRSLDLRAEGYFFKPFDEIIIGEDQIPELNTVSDIHWVGNLNMVYHTVLGPVSLSFNYYPSHTQKFGLLLHLGYVIYNKKSME